MASVEVPSLEKGLKNFEEEVLKREKLDVEGIKQLIRKIGLKVTHQRVAILEALSSGRVHVTAQEVFEAVSKTHKDIGFATVYRFLRKMVEKKIVTEVRMGGLAARYELTPRGHHDHLTCLGCGKLVEFENNEIERLQEKVARDNGFKLTGHVLELYGLCHKCQ